MDGGREYLRFSPGSVTVKLCDKFSKRWIGHLKFTYLLGRNTNAGVSLGKAQQSSGQ